MTNFSSPGIQLSRGIRRIIPSTFMFNSNNIPEELKRISRWTTWSHIEQDDGEQQKAPCKITGNTFHRVKWKKDPDNILSFQQALDHLSEYPQHIHGLAFILPEDGYVYIDLDKLQDDDIRLEFLKGLDTYIEYSQSGKGIHAIVKGSLDRAHKTAEVELYPRGRACALTGMLHELGSVNVSDGRLAIDALCEAYPKGRQSGNGTEEHRGYQLPKTIEEGSRNNEIWSYIWSLIGKRELNKEEITQQVLLTNEQRCFPPLETEVVMDQLTRAFDAAKDDMEQDEKFVQKYIFIKSSQKFLDIDTKISLSKDAINIAHSRTHPGGRNELPLMANYLRRHPKFRIADDQIWKPVPYGIEHNHETVQIDSIVYANTWRGFAIHPKEGNIQPWLDLLDHIVPNQESKQKIIERFAFDIQHPDMKCNWQVVIHGIEGAGKDSLIKPLARIFGQASGSVGNNDIKGSFDDGFVKKKFVSVSEVRGISGDALEELKRKSASEGNAMLCLNPKKESKVWQENLWSLVFLTNHSDAMKMSVTERRFFVLRVDSVWNSEFFDAYHAWADGDGPSYLMDYLLKVDLSKFNPNKLPSRTKEFYDMIDMTYDQAEDLMLEWSQMQEKMFSFPFVNSNHLVKALENAGAKVRSQSIKKWLDKSGWSPYPRKIQKKIDGRLKTKSRAYFIKRDSGWLEKTPSDVFDEVDRIEKLIEEAYREGHSKYM